MRLVMAIGCVVAAILIGVSAAGGGVLGWGNQGRSGRLGWRAMSASPLGSMTRVSGWAVSQVFQVTFWVEMGERNSVGLVLAGVWPVRPLMNWPSLRL